MSDVFAVINEKELKATVLDKQVGIFVPLSCMGEPGNFIVDEDVWACSGCSNDNCSCNRRNLPSCF